MKTRTQKVASFEIGQELVVRSAPRTGLYQVKCAEPANEGAKTIASSGRIVRKGEPLGFRQHADGQVLAVAGAEQFELAFAPAEATRFVWYHRSKQKTQFGREMDKALAVGAQVAQVTAMVGLFVGAKMLEAELEEQQDCHQRHRHDQGKNRRHKDRN